MTELERIQTFQIRTLFIPQVTPLNAEVALRYRDGTSRTETGFVDVQSGSIHLPFGYLIIPGNLDATNRIYPSGGQATINSTETRTYSSGNRQTLYHIIDATYDISYERKEVAFDKIKGIAVEFKFESRETVSLYTETFKETITNTNSDIWSVIPEFPSAAVLMALLIALPIVLVAYKKKGLANHKFAVVLKQ